MGEDDMPDDPLAVPDNGPLGFAGQILGEARYLLDALEEARLRGTAFEAVWALDVADLRVLAIARVFDDAFRAGLRGEEPER